VAKARRRLILAGCGGSCTVGVGLGAIGVCLLGGCAAAAGHAPMPPISVDDEEAVRGIIITLDLFLRE